MPWVLILWLTVGTVLAAFIVAAVVLPLIFPPKGRRSPSLACVLTMFEFTPVCPYCAVLSAYPWVAQTSACGETKHVQAGPAYCPECGAVQDAAVDDENLSDIERRTGWRKTHE